MLCVVTGASGYIGGRLVPQLLKAGHRVRCVVRNPDKLRDVPWRAQVEVVGADLLDAGSFEPALEGGDVLYYLVHSLSTSGFAEVDRRAATNAAEAADAAEAPSDPLPSDPQWAGGSAYTDVRERETTAAPSRVWPVIAGIGGQNGWYSFPLAWAVRGWADRLVGGVGLRRGRRDAHQLRVGEALDWWRVEELEDGRLLRLRAEMKVPGLAWLELSVRPRAGGGSVYRQRAVFVPRGLAGQVYWWSVAPFHGLVFGGMARNILRAAEHGDSPVGTDRSGSA